MTETTTPRRGLTRGQVQRLLKSIDPAHVEQKNRMSYISQHQARAELTRIFGPGNWDTQVESMEFIYETVLNKGDVGYPEKGNGKPYFVTCYKASVRLNIRDYWGNPIASFVEYHAEENAPLPSRGEAHAMAITSVESYAFRRAAIGLGDRLGLGLYEKGALTPLVGGTLMVQGDTESPLYVAPQRSAGADVPKDPGVDERAAGDMLQGGIKH